MSEKTSPKAAYELEYYVDRDNNSEVLEIKDIPYDVYNAAQNYFRTETDKALQILINDVGLTGKETALSHIEKGNLVAINSLETVFAELILPIKGKIKKK